MHDRGDRPPADAIDRYWDELFGDAPTSADPAALDPDLAATVRRLRALNSAPTADPVFASRLWDDLMHAHGTADDLGLPRPATRRHSAAPSPCPVTRPPRRSACRESRRRSGVARFATSLLVLLGLGLVYVLLGPGRPNAGQRAAIPAPVAPTATPAAGVTAEETLVTLPLAAAALPDKAHAMGGLNRIVMAPSSATAWEASRGAAHPGLRFEYVLAGSYTVRVAGPAQVLRTGAGTPDAVPAGTEVALGPGDALAFANGSAAAYDNPGTAPVELLFWILFDASSGGYETDPVPTGWIITDLDLQTAGLAVPTGPATLRLRRVELAADAVFPAPPSGVLQFRVALPANAAGTPTASYALERPSDGSIRNGARRPASVGVLTLEPGGGERGSPTP